MNTPNIKPESLLTAFSKTHLMMYIVVALVIHIVLIGITSIPYVFSPGSDADAEEVEVLVEETTTPAGTEVVAETPVDTPDAAADEEAELSEIEKRVSEVAKPEDIPRSPDPLEIPLDTTN